MPAPSASPPAPPAPPFGVTRSGPHAAAADSGGASGGALLARGTHAVLDAAGCDPALLDDPDAVEASVAAAVAAAPCRLLHLHVARFCPRGLTAVAVLAESHLSVHTWPEHGRAALDAFTCGPADAAGLLARVARDLGCPDPRPRSLPRGPDHA